MPPRIIFIVGPTGVGKTNAAIDLATRVGGEIVSCDAMQVYREVRIASAKPSPQEQRQIPHHLLDAASVTETFDVARYRQLANAAIDDILKRGKVAIVAGGSGMYMSVLLDGIFQSAAKDEGLRLALQEQAQVLGAAALHEQLHQLDPKAAAKIHPNDQKRLVRALEVNLLVGRPIAELQQTRAGLWAKEKDYGIEILGLNCPREVLYRRIEARVERMFEAGLVEEVKGLLKLPLSRTAATLIGIPEVGGYLRGEYDVARAKYLLKRNTRHYAKRQLTWFHRDERIQWKIGASPLFPHIERK